MTPTFPVLHAFLFQSGADQTIEGERIVFPLATGQTCTGTTSDNGEAVCSDPTFVALALANRGYDARFAGDTYFQGTQSHGEVFVVA